MTATAPWEIEGEYSESCSCRFLCPCVVEDLKQPATEAFCRAAMAFHIERGRYGELDLDGLNFAVVAETGKVMADGNWRLGLIVDERADEARTQAIGTIASGKAGGPMAALAPLLGEFLGVVQAPFIRSGSGMARSVRVGELVDYRLQGVPSAAAPGECIAIDNTLHPANKRLNLAKADHQRFNAFGIEWQDGSGSRNAHFARFHWTGG